MRRDLLLVRSSVVVEDVEESIEIHLGVELSVLESGEGLLRVVRRVLDGVLGDVVPWPERRRGREKSKIESARSERILNREEEESMLTSQRRWDGEERGSWRREPSASDPCFQFVEPLSEVGNENSISSTLLESLDASKETSDSHRCFAFSKLDTKSARAFGSLCPSFLDPGGPCCCCGGCCC